jgi:colanic acid/amylovoran biosynthesis glycosyltransferase
MEAQALGIPVISTFHSGIPEVVSHGETGILVPERDVMGLKNELLKMIQNKDKRQSMGTNGRFRIEKEYDVNVLNDRLVELYEELIRKN